MKAISLILADDHNVVRKGLRSLLEKIPDFKVLGEASNGSEALELIAAQQPDVVLMDIGMPVLNGIDTTARIRAQHPEVRVLILSMYDSEEFLFQALQAGINGYVLKDAGAAELELAIRAAARGDCYLSPAITKYVVSEYIESKPKDFSPVTKLTRRQREILQLVAEGQTSAQIAKRFGLSLKTVEAHRAEIMTRLEIHDVAGLTRFAVRFGLVQP